MIKNPTYKFYEYNHLRADGTTSLRVAAVSSFAGKPVKGYADCHPNDSVARCSFDIDWAVTAEGNPIGLPCVDFVRVYTGVFQQCGWTGEISTEISHARDLNLE
jgi:hypothetical protein